MRSELMKLIKSGRFPNEKNRVWTMCQVALHMATLAADEAERLKLTDEQFYINLKMHLIFYLLEIILAIQNKLKNLRKQLNHLKLIQSNLG